MEGKIALLLGIHNHQPVGNFDHIFEKAYQDAYAPFLKILSGFPDIKISLHYSGCLLEWLEVNHPEMLSLVAALVKRGQVSLISGGFYEPILPIIPRRDARDQIFSLNSYLKENFGSFPRGFWLTERVWEPDIPRIVSATGIEYTMVDDTHFIAAGVKREEINGVFITEDRGAALKIFPIDKTLRYIIPFRMPEETISYLKQARDRGVKAVTLADDGEKFGLWPGTKKWVYEEKWLLKFLTLLHKSDFIETVTFDEYLDRTGSFRRIYLPAASYEEMMEWSGGFFRNFLAKYPEANNLYSKMLRVSEKVYRASVAEKREEMKKFLWKGQCSCPYWHGVFGGLYLPYLREANYTNLLKAEVLAARALKEDAAGVIKTDFDHDGRDEVLVETTDVNLYFKPDYGAGIFEMDYKPRSINMQDVLTRRPEVYHGKIKAAHGTRGSGHASIHEIDKKADFDPRAFLAYDEYQRNSFLLRLMSSFKEEIIKDGKRGECEDILLGQYSVKVEGGKEEITLVFEKTAVFGSSVFNISKRVYLNQRGGEIGYEIELMLEKGEWQGYAGVEFCIAILKGESCRIKEGFSVKDSYRDIKVGFTAVPEAFWWLGHLETVSQSENGYELIPQATIVFPYWRVNLKSGEKTNFYLRERIQ